MCSATVAKLYVPPFIYTALKRMLELQTRFFNIVGLMYWRCSGRNNKHKDLISSLYGF
jgi:hypothetical protein